MKIREYVLIRETMLSSKALDRITGSQENKQIYLKIVALKEKLDFRKNVILKELDSTISDNLSIKNIDQVNELVSLKRDVFNERILSYTGKNYSDYNFLLNSIYELKKSFENRKTLNSFSFSKSINSKISSSFMLSDLNLYKSWINSNQSKRFLTTLHSTLYRATYKTVPLNYLCTAQIISTLDSPTEPSKVRDYKFNKFYFQELFEWLIRSDKEFINFFPLGINPYSLSNNLINFYSIARNGIKYRDVFSEVETDSELENILAHFSNSKSLINCESNFDTEELKFWYSGGLIFNKLYRVLHDDFWCSKWIRYFQLNRIKISDSLYHFLRCLERIQIKLRLDSDISLNQINNYREQIYSEVRKLGVTAQVLDNLVPKEKIFTLDVYRKREYLYQNDFNTIKSSIGNLKNLFTFLSNSYYHNEKYNSILNYFRSQKKEEIPFFDFYYKYHINNRHDEICREEISKSWSKKIDVLNSIAVKKNDFIDLNPGNENLSNFFHYDKDLRSPLNSSYSVILQMHRGKVHLNGVGPGNGRMFSRFLKNYPNVTHAFRQYNQELEQNLPLSILIDNRETCNFNYNDRPRLFRYHLDIPSTIESSKSKIAFQDLCVRFDKKLERLVLFDNRLQKNIFLNDTNLQSFELRSNLITFLLLLSNQSYTDMGDYLLNRFQNNHKESLSQEVICMPEIRYNGKVILRMKKFSICKNTFLNLSLNLPDLIEFLLKVKVPEKTLYTIRDNRIQKTGFLDIFDPLSIDKLVKELNNTDSRYFELNAFPLQNGRQKEFVLQVDTFLND